MLLRLAWPMVVSRGTELFPGGADINNRGRTTFRDEIQVCIPVGRISAIPSLLGNPKKPSDTGYCDSGRSRKTYGRDETYQTTVCDMNWIEASWPLHGRLTVATIPQRWAELCRSADGCFLGQTHWRQIGILRRMKYKGCRLRPRNAGRACTRGHPGSFGHQTGRSAGGGAALTDGQPCCILFGQRA